MRKLMTALSAALLCAGAAHASPSNPVNGADYTTLAQAQPVQKVGQKVEVIEFFMYHCPACYATEAPLSDWVKKNEERVNFRRIHLSSGEADDYEARLFATLEALQLQDSLHDKVLAAWHQERRRLRSDDENLQWALRNGIDKERFLAAYKSFGVQMRLKSLARMASNYGVTGTPTIIVQGKYVTDPSTVHDANRHLAREDIMPATLQVLDKLVERARQ